MVCVTGQKLIGSDLTVDEIAKLGDFASSRSAEQFTVHLLPGEGYNYQPPVTHGITSYSVWMMHKQPVIDLLNKRTEMWVFGKDVKEREVYIKITLGYQNGQTICISFHLAEHPMRYPFKLK